MREHYCIISDSYKYKFPYDFINHANFNKLNFQENSLKPKRRMTCEPLRYPILTPLSIAPMAESCPIAYGLLVFEGLRPDCTKRSGRPLAALHPSGLRSPVNLARLT